MRQCSRQQLRHGIDSGDLCSTGAYDYDGAGNIKMIGNTTYVYDPLQQFRTASTNNGFGSFNATTTNYDPFGNVRSTTQSYCGASNARCGSSTSLARNFDPASNHDLALVYDSAGAVTSDGHRTFTYDALGMTKTASVTGRSFVYLYDSDDERLAIVEPKSFNGVMRNRTTWTIRGFSNQLLRSYVDDAWSGTRTINRKEHEIWRGNSLLASDSLARGIRHYVLDHLGSPRYLVTGGGAYLGTQTFSPWGAGGTTDGGLLQFTGHERDSANVADLSQSPDASSADLPDDFHARLYDPLRGRFLSPDSVTTPSDELQLIRWNRYPYASNNPIRYTDPDGKEVLGALLGGLVSVGAESIRQIRSGEPVNNRRLLSSLAGGLTAGAIGGLGVTYKAAVLAGSIGSALGGAVERKLNGEKTSAKDVAIEAASGAVGSVAGRFTGRLLTGISERSGKLNELAWKAAVQRAESSAAHTGLGADKYTVRAAEKVVKGLAGAGDTVGELASDKAKREITDIWKDRKRPEDKQ